MSYEDLNYENRLVRSSLRYLTFQMFKIVKLIKKLDVYFKRNTLIYTYHE